MFFGLCAGCFYKKRMADDEPVFVDEDAPTLYFDPDDPTIGSYCLARYCQNKINLNGRFCVLIIVSSDLYFFRF